ncbi:uncharacterized protein LOC111320115, partial [Stylophora pistillata]|uniref:uncharacterized protein LOC111320115 n=1 Tax=Stylophora pistillata TaxID=50429 RepID=UPI000C046FBC
RDSEGNTPLAYAAACGQIEAVNCLLEHGADPSLKGQDGWSLLHFAAQSGNVTIIDTMLSKGLNIDSRGETRGLTPLLVSLKNDKLEAAKHLIVKGANVSLKFKAEMNALSIAAITGSVAAIKMLLPHGFYIDSRDADGNTPSLMAAKCGNTEALNYLLAKGADPLLQNNNEFGLLHLAALSNNVATIEAVLSKKKFDINVRGSCMSLTPLLACLNMGNLEAANYLLKRGADEHIKGKEGLTALSVAARSGNVAAIEMLVNRGHDPNSRDGCDKTPIMWAVESGNRAAVEYLLRLTHEGLLPTTD